MRQISLGSYLISRLMEVGVRHVFGVPGDYNLPFLQQLESAGAPKYIGCCNELNAAYAADGNARLAGISAVVTTYGVGELSALNGAAGAYAEHVPLIFITGAPPLSLMRKRALLHHTLADGDFDNTFSCFRHFTVAQSRLTPMNAHAEIDRLLTICWQEKRPVYLQLPCDLPMLQMAGSNEPLTLFNTNVNPAHQDAALAAMRTALHNAHSPAMLLDAAVDRFNLSTAVLDFAKSRHIPFAMLSSAKSILPETHPLCLGIYAGQFSQENTRHTIEKSDCLLCFDTRLTDLATGLFSHALPADKLIQIGATYITIGAQTFDGLDMRLLLESLSLTPLSSPPPIPPDIPAANVARSADAQLDFSRFWQRAGAFISAGDVVVAEAGTSIMMLNRINLPDDVQVVSQPIWSSIGYALPAVLGSALAQPDRRHLLFIGDGAFQMTAQELSTILSHDIKPIIFLINNDGYTIERCILGADAKFNDVNPWRYAELIGALCKTADASSCTVNTEGELEDALLKAASARYTTFIEVVLERMDVPDKILKLGQELANMNYGMAYAESSATPVTAALNE